MRIALVHEFLNQLGGAERVLLTFLEIWPEATVHTLLYDEKKTNGLFKPFRKIVSFLNKLPFAKSHPKLFLALMPWAIERFDFRNFDVVLSDSSSFAHASKTTNQLHICYCHTPARFLWTESDSYVGDLKYPRVFKLAARLVIPILRRWDYRTAQRPKYIIANSNNVSGRIKKYFDRDSIVIFPPIDTKFFFPGSRKRDYFFTVTRLEPYKKTDLLVETFNKLGWPLRVAGIGTDYERLKQIAKPNIEFLGRVPDTHLRTLYQEARAFIFPAEEDAGMTVVEAMACGTPVIAFKKGGALETVIEGLSGEFFDEQTVESLSRTLVKFDASNYDPKFVREQALKYDKQLFMDKIKKFVESKYNENRS